MVKIVSTHFITFFLRKLAFLLIAMFIALNFVFFFPRMMPFTPVDIMLGRIAGGEATGLGTTGATTGDISQLGRLQVLRIIYEEKFGISDPIQIQYLKFWRRIFTLDFGLSYWQYPRSVAELVSLSLPWTLALVIPVLPVGYIVGNWIGSRAAFYKGRFDKVIYYILLFLSRAPYYWFALVFMLVFGVYLQWFPTRGAYSSRWLAPTLSIEWFLDAAWHYCLPFLSLVGLGIGGWGVGMRALMIYEAESDYVQYLQQLGFSKNKLRKYAMRNAILPNFTGLPLTLSSLVSQTLLVETVFGYPGLGTLSYNAVYSADYPLLEATFLFTIAIVLVGNFICDVLYGILDPRIGARYVGGE